MQDRLEAERNLFNRCSFYDLRTCRWSRDNYWKGPLRVVVEADEVEAMRSAILGFVGGLDKEEELDSGMVLLESRGYYHYIGA